MDLNETAFGRQKDIELKKIATVVQDLNFWELDKLGGGEGGQQES